MNDQVEINIEGLKKIQWLKNIMVLESLGLG